MTKKRSVSTPWGKTYIINVTFEYPPIPDRRWDWVAVDDNYEGGAPIGHGPTEEAAVADLLIELEMRDAMEQLS